MRSGTRPAVIAGICVLASLAGLCPAAEEHVLVRRRKPGACLVLGGQPAWQDRFIAEELRDYVAKMTGATLAIHGVDDPKRPAGLLPVLIGRPGTNEAVAELARLGSIRLDEKELTAEGFILKTTTWKQKPCLVVAGVSDVGTVYAGYDLLERFGRVGFFRYEEHVPKRSNFAVPVCDVRQRPHFRVRMHGG